MKHKSLYLTLAVLIAAAAVAGCQSNKVGTVQRRIPRGDPNYVVDSRLNFPRSFRRVFNIDAVNTSTTDAGFLKVQIRLRNQSEEKQQLEYRFEWTDSEGMLVETPASRWLLKQFKPGESAFITAVAPTADTKDFYIKMQHKSREEE